MKQGYFDNPKLIIGLVTKQAIYPGRIITSRNLRLPRLINRGDPVTITAINSGIKVSIKGISLNNGKLGDLIRVKNLSSSRIVNAKIVAKHQVEINI